MSSSYSATSGLNSRLPLGAIQKTSGSSSTKTTGHYSRSPKSSAAMDYKSSQMHNSLGVASGPRTDYNRRVAALSGVPGLDKSLINSPRHPRDPSKNGLPPVKPSPRASKDSVISRKDTIKNGQDTGSGGRSPEPSDKKGENESPRKAPAPALNLDFIKAALSNNKQVFSNQQIREKAANWTTEKTPSHGPNKKTSKHKSQSGNGSTNNSTRTDSEQRGSNPEEKDAKIIEIFSNEGFAPKGKSNELGTQLKALRRRLAPETLEEMEEETEQSQGATAASFSYF